MSGGRTCRGSASRSLRPRCALTTGTSRSSDHSSAWPSWSLVFLPLIVDAPAVQRLRDPADWVNGFADAGVFVLLALGLNIVVGFAGLLDLGYAAFFAIGAYTYALLRRRRQLHERLAHPASG